MELLAYIIADTVSAARYILDIWVNDSYSLTAQGETYVAELASLLSQLVNSTAQTIAEWL